MSFTWSRASWLMSIGNGKCCPKATTDRTMSVLVIGAEFHAYMERSAASTQLLLSALSLSAILTALFRYLLNLSTNCPLWLPLESLCSRMVRNWHMVVNTAKNLVSASTTSRRGKPIALHASCRSVIEKVVDDASEMGHANTAPVMRSMTMKRYL